MIDDNPASKALLKIVKVPDYLHFMVRKYFGTLLRCGLRCKLTQCSKSLPSCPKAENIKYILPVSVNCAKA